MKSSRACFSICLLTLLLTSGCGALYERRASQGRYDYWNTSDSHMGPSDRYYIGTKFDYWVVSDRSFSPPAHVFGGLDLPLTCLIDTVLLALDFTLTQLDSPEK